MNYNHFVSNEGWISFNYPSNLTFEEEEEGTYLFYTEDTGSFRITPIKLKGGDNFNSHKYLNDLANENNVEISQDFKNECVYYISHSADDEDLTIFNWIFAVDDKIVYCSYTIDTDSFNDTEIINEKNEILKIIQNLQINTEKNAS